MPEPPHCIGQDILMPHTMPVSQDEESEDDDEDDSLEEQDVDEANENNLLKKQLENDEVMGKIFDDNMGQRSRRWCESPDRLEAVLKYPFVGMEHNSDLPLASVAVINPGPREIDYRTTTEPATTESSQTTSAHDLITSNYTEDSTGNASATQQQARSGKLQKLLQVEPSGQIDKKGMHPPGATILFRCVPVPGELVFHMAYGQKSYTFHTLTRMLLENSNLHVVSQSCCKL